MILNQFIDTGADNATVNDMKKSIAREGDLQKAMNRAGLVQKEVQVKGKNGQVFTRKQWVKASDTAAAQTQTQSKQSSASGITEDDIKSEFKKTSVSVKDKWGDIIDTHTGYAGKNGNLCSVEKKGSKWVVNLGDTSRGFVAQTTKDTEEEAYALMYKDLGGTKKTSSNTTVTQPKQSIDKNQSSNKAKTSLDKNNQGKMNHQTGVREKKAATMIEDYFAGNHSHEDGKKALAGLLGKGYSREDIMEQAEKSGVTWKKNDHAGINWMRASMAIQKHLMAAPNDNDNDNDNNNEKTKNTKTPKDSNQSSSNHSLKGELSFENQAVHISQLHDMGKLATYIGNGKNRKFDVKKANAALKTFADEFGITENGGKLEITETGFITATSADGVTKKFYKIKTPNESENFIISDRQIDSFLKARGQTFDESKINRISKERYGRRFYDIFHEKNG